MIDFFTIKFFVHFYKSQTSRPNDEIQIFFLLLVKRFLINLSMRQKGKNSNLGV